MRKEKDFLGAIEIDDNALYGIHSLRANQNFPNTIPFPIEWYKAMGTVKLACYYTYEHFKNEAQKQNLHQRIPFFSDEILNALQAAAAKIEQGHYFEHFIVPAIQGGAGTSINMNVNEIIANAALIHLNHQPGQYEIIDPIEHANIYQSTNDTVVTALKVALLKLLEELEDAINQTRSLLESLENKYRNVLRLGYTQMQEAVPTTFGKLFSAYNDALSRDWWRTSKCFERIKVVNLGGGAIGTGLAIPRFYMMEVVNELKRMTNLPIARGENLTDTTQNLDSFVEIHAILKAHAVNLEKIANDLRLLSADAGIRIVHLPEVQAGSSIMPGKVNPVINEYIISIAHQIYSNDMLISNLCGQGCLDLNAYTPIIGYSLINSLKLLISANIALSQRCLINLTIDSERSLEQLLLSPSISTALIPYIGYHKATDLALFMKTNRLNIIEANRKLKLIDETKLNELLSPENLTKMGFSLKEIQI
ncbi:MAG: aspartate ammonia-lyase [Bacteroidales bacterium]|nr:aspartate ammonia-lyase [Bacteroidales bacterium]